MIFEIRVMAIALNEDGKALRFYRSLHTLLSIGPRSPHLSLQRRSSSANKPIWSERFAQ